MQYSGADYLVQGKRYTISFGWQGVIPGEGALFNQADIQNIIAAFPWVSNISFNNPTGQPYAELTFTCAIPIAADALGETLAAGFNEIYGSAVTVTYLSTSDAGEGIVSTPPDGGGCSLNNLGACFKDAKTLLIVGVIGLAIVAFIASGGPGLLRGVSGK